MNKLIRGLLSGASLATLQLCAVGVARASAIVVSGAQTTGPITVTPGQHPDYILINGTVNGDVTNEGTIGPVAYYGVEINGTVTGAFINAKTGILSGSEIGIDVGGAALIGDGIANAGQILVSNTTDTHGEVTGRAVVYNSASVAAVTNSGSLGVNVQVVGTNTDDAEAKSFGLEENINAGHTAHGTARYSGAGAINLKAGAIASSESAYAHAEAQQALTQYVVYAGGTKETISNSGSLSLSAVAHAVATTEQARAYATAGTVIAQGAYNDTSAHGAWVNLAMTNNGSLTLQAKATATGETRAEVEGKVKGVFNQQATNIDAIVESVTNSGALTLSAAAKAVGLTHEAYVSASARADDIFHQTARNYTTDGISSVQTITNSGDVGITLAAHALRSATGTSEPENSAGVLAERIFYQRAGAIADITQTITNSGAITIYGNATATGAQSQTSAHANFEHAFEQSANADNSATLSIVNSAPMTVLMTALANGPSAAANVAVEALGYQAANAEQTVSEKFTNSGVISIGMLASAAGDDVAARARLQGGIVQFGGSIASITQSIANSGSLLFNLTAHAEGVTGASARATGLKLFSQNAEGVVAVTQGLVNTGDVSVALAANAVAADAGAFASASMRNGTAIKQEGFGAQNILQTITNSGSLTFDLAASAQGAHGSVTAHARIEGIVQEGRGEGAISQSLTNSGVLGFDLAAKAVNAGTTGHVHATARISTAIKQTARFSASSPTSDEKITQAISNSGTLSLTGSASAKGGQTAQAYVNGGDFIKQDAGYATNISQAVTNSGSILVQETARAEGAVSYNVNATSDSIIRQRAYQYGDPGDTAALTVANKGIISATMNATAVGMGTHKVSARAYDSAVVNQSVPRGDTVSETVSNSGTITLKNNANAIGGLNGDADAYTSGFVRQEVEDVSAATISATNSGTILAREIANAVVSGIGSAYADAFGGYQSIRRDDFDGDMTAMLSLTNSGSINFFASAKITAGIFGRANASATGFEQSVQDTAATVAANNSGTLTVAAIATGLPGKPGAGVTETTTRLSVIDARANGLHIIGRGHTGISSQNGSATFVTHGAPLTLAVSNSGTLNVSAVANGASLAAANINALATGVALTAASRTNYFYDFVGNGTGYQRSTEYRNGGGKLSGLIDNSGSLVVSASADGGEAIAKGVYIETGTLSADTINEKNALISVNASGATAQAIGIVENYSSYARTTSDHQVNGTTTHGTVRTYKETDTQINGAATDVTGNITNSGTISVSATGDGVNISNSGVVLFSEEGPPLPSASDNKARAEGILINAQTMSGAILNAGIINVTAIGPEAIANGIHVLASQTEKHSVYTEIYKYRATASNYGWTSVSSTQTNHTAVLEGSVFSGKLSNSGTISVTASGADAAATGVLIEDAIYNGAVVNTGKIIVTADGAGASAVGVKIDAASLGDAASFQNNGGTISATLNGKWGSAIDVSGAPSALALGLNGGFIYGNIVENTAGNAITVGSGNLVLNGLINPSKAKLGSLTVNSGGTLTLASNTGQGPATAYVQTFNQIGTLSFYAAPNASASGSIQAGAATISGPVSVHIAPTQAPYALSTTYKVIASDAPLSGTWSDVDLLGNSVFFTATSQYSANEADVVLTRLALGDLPGLTPNESSVGSALETIYESSGTAGPLGKLLGALFNLTGPQYASALEALSGVPAGQLTSANNQSAQSFLDAIETHLGGDVTSGPQGVASMAAPSSSTMQASVLAPSATNGVMPAELSDVTVSNVWGGAIMGGGHTNATISGPGYNTSESGLIAGVDLPITPNLVAGIVGSWSSGNLNTDHQLGQGRFSAGQIAGYARYHSDAGFYALATVAYGDFENKLDRYISIPGFGSGTTHGKFSTDVFSTYGEAGWHFDATGIATITPYVAFSYQDASADGYTETGFVPLTISGSSSKSTSSYLGLSVARTWDDGSTTVTPHLKAAWQHDFNSDAWVMQAAFAAVPTVGFGLNGSGLSRDSAYINGGITLGIAQNVDLLLDYDGRFSSDQSESSVMARANFKF